MSTSTPPKFFLRLFKWFCDPELHIYIEGDLLELYRERVKDWGKKKADRRFARDVLLLFRPGIIRPTQLLNNVNAYGMFKHNLLISWRSFKKDKTTFLISLIGLAVSLACVLLIYFWVDSEYQVDKFHEKKDRLYQLIVHYHSEKGLDTGNSTPAQLAEAFEAEMPEVENSVAVRSIDHATLSVGEDNIKANGKYVSTDFFEAFTYPLLEGDEREAIAKNSAIVISEDLARKFFNTTNHLIGKTIKFQQDQSLQITGVFKSPPEDATLQFDFVLPFEAFKATNNWALNWNYSTVDTYVTLNKSTDLAAFNTKIAGFLDTKRVNMLPTTLEATNYAELYLYGRFENGKAIGGRIEYIHLFSIIALFILLIACVNFMNLSTAKATRRLKEIGVKKVIGAKRKNLIAQFLSESCVLAFLALILAGGTVWLLLPTFGHLAGKEINVALNSKLILAVLGLTIGAGLLAGSYPALFLSGFQLKKILKNQARKTSMEVWIRKGLVVFQFAISMVFIIAVFVISQQIKFIQSQNLGYDKENIIQFGMEGQAKEKLATFLAAVNQLPSIEQASSMGQSIVGGMNRITVQKWEGEENNQVSFGMRAVYYDLLEALNIKMKAGRSFSKAFNNENNKIIFNEAAIDFMGLQDPIGKQVTIENEEFQIIGVVENFHYASLKETIRPLFFVFRPSWTHLAMAKIEPGREKSAVAELKALYNDFNPGFPFEYEFLDQEYQAQYITEQRVESFSKYFAFLAIFLSCFGLFGLSIFNAETRVKEIGIRKVLGASIPHIVTSLSLDFIKLVLIAFLVGIPIAYYFSNNWLQNFAYHIHMQWWMFALAGVLAVSIAFFTVSFQSIKAALANPVIALKRE